MNDPIIHAPISKIFEAIKDISHRAECTLEKMWFEVGDDEPLECSCDFKDRITEALASLESHPSEREVLMVLREVVMRNQMLFPETEQDEKWFSEKLETMHPFTLQRIFDLLGLGGDRYLEEKGGEG